MTSALADIVGLPPSALFPLGVFVVLIVIQAVFVATRYKRCPANKVLVIYGKTGGDKGFITRRSGGTVVWPLVQDYAYLSLEPIRLDVRVEEAGVVADGEMVVAIDPEEPALDCAAERLLGLSEAQIADTARSVIEPRFREAMDESAASRQTLRERLTETARRSLAEIGLLLVSLNLRTLRLPGEPATALSERTAP